MPDAKEHMSFLLIVAVLLAFLSTPAATPPSPQTATTYPRDRDAQCAACRINLEPIAEIGSPRGTPGAICEKSAFLAANDATGTFFVAPVCEENAVGVYGPDGSYIDSLTHEVFSSVRRLWYFEDHLHAFNLALQHAVLTSEGKLVRVVANPGLPHDVVFLGGGNGTVQNLILHSPEAVGLPLHHVNEEGRIQNSFGMQRAQYRADQPSQLARSLARSGESEVSAAPISPYRIESWDLDGELVQALTRQPAWFVAEPQALAARVVSVRIDDAGRLWTMSLVLVDPGARLRPRPWGTEEATRYADTMIEVLVPAQDQTALVSSLRSDLILTRWVGDMTYSFHDQEDGTVLLKVWKVTLDEA